MTDTEGRGSWSPEERQLYDARADHERWDFTWRVLRHWVESAREIGHPELIAVMERAFEAVEENVYSSLAALESLEAERERKARRGEGVTES